MYAYGLLLLYRSVQYLECSTFINVALSGFSSILIQSSVAEHTLYCYDMSVSLFFCEGYSMGCRVISNLVPLINHQNKVMNESDGSADKVDTKARKRGKKLSIGACSHWLQTA